MARVGQIDLFTKRIRRPPPPPEFSTHVMVADILRRWVSPGWRWTHLPLGEARPSFTNKKGKRISVTGSRLKRMGVNPGWFDFELLSPIGQAHFLELKRRGEALSKDQQDFDDWCRAHGVPCACADDFAKAIAILKQWGALRTGIEVQ